METQERAALGRELAALVLLPYFDQQAAIEPVRDALARAEALGHDDLLMRARLIHADVIGRQGDITGSVKIALVAGEWATNQGDADVLARSERLLSTFHGRVGDVPTSLAHAVRAVELLADDAPALLRADHLMALGIALARAGSYEEAQVRLNAVLAIADDVGDARLMAAALNNVAFIAYWAGDGQTAMDVARRMQLTAERNGIQLQAAHLDTVARAHMMLGQYDEAEQLIAPLLLPEAAKLLTEADDKAGNLLTVAECQRRRGALDEATRSLALAEAECEERGLGGMLVEVMQEQAATLAAQGAYQLAYERHVQFHAASEALISEEREARTRALQAVFETEEARRTGRQFREMSMRDPLTGLYNRRYVDTRLGALARRAAEEGSPLSVAIVDLDYFKRVNDEVSHEAGDEVLRQLAPLLEEAAAPHGFAARLGGEEFLLVLAGEAAAGAEAACQAFCETVRSYPWASIVGAVPVTASIGVVTTVGGERSASQLMSDADRLLYVSKRTGRDRVTAS